MDKIHAMQLFVRVAELESFSRAAESLTLPKGRRWKTDWEPSYCTEPRVA